MATVNAFNGRIYIGPPIDAYIAVDKNGRAILTRKANVRLMSLIEQYGPWGIRFTLVDLIKRMDQERMDQV